MNIFKSIYSKLRLVKLVSYLRHHNAFFARFWLTAMLKKNATQRFVLVYTMGKVGSTSISNSLKSQLKGYSVYNVHWLNKSNLRADQQFHKKLYHEHKNNGKESNVLPDYIIRGFYVSDLISNSNPNSDKHKVITLVRDPVAREVSSFFQNSERFFGINFEGIDKSNQEATLERLIDVFLNDFISRNGIDFLDADPLTWFDEEIEKVFNVNVYDSQFPKGKGYMLFKNDGVDVLLIRLEDLNRCFSEASAQLLGKEQKIIKSKNTAGKKNYSSIYAAFKNRLELPEWYLDKMYESKYAKHFYTPNERLGFREKWTDRL
ncbi:MAG TPA: putative capsular polysaccharide synthesis family protein [Chitinophagaceae bacterium]|nr:putative capsular polysaccharide synthesis family protein [Chitinophagaceae bacterium]